MCIYTGAGATHLVTDVNGTFPAGASYTPLTPARLLDSRPGTSTTDGQYVGTGITQPGTTVQLQVAGRGGVPSDAAAAVLNVTATGATGNGFLTVYPCGQTRPLASNLNYSAGADAANAAVTRIGQSGKVCIYTGAGATHLVVDVNGVLPGTQFVSPGNSRGCVFTTAPGASIPFCETFDAPLGDPSRRSGDLEPVLWGVSRTNTYVNLGQNNYNDWLPATLQGCGAPHTVVAPRDVQICDGQVFEAVNDGHIDGQTTLAMYPKQPFDIGGGRTGTVVFDVSSDSDSNHAAWPEFWWTDKPVPAPRGHLPSQNPYARHSFGFSMAAQCPGNRVSIDKIMFTRNYAYEELAVTPIDCVAKGVAGGPLNHIEVRISTSHVDIYASDPGSTAVRKIASSDNINLTFTRGLVWLEDVHYNGCKLAPDDQCDHTFAWDNLGFDGPATYRDLSFDVPDANVPGAIAGSTRLGYLVASGGTDLTVNGVFRNKTPTDGLLTFNWYPYPGATVPTFRINGGPLHTTPWPWPETEAYAWRTIDVGGLLSEIHDGSNTITIYANQGTDGVVVSNVNLILVNAADVP